ESEQVLAVSLMIPPDVSNEFVAADAKVLRHLAPEYAESHPLAGNKEQTKFGYGSWFCIGIVLGGFLAAVRLRTWKARASAVWWRQNRNAPIALRLTASFCGGVLMLVGAALAHGGAAGHFVSGWAQLSLSAVPFTIAMLGFGMLVAYGVYPRTPNID
ncbi:MAG: YeeE/YedE thiosulfate transporter family protein, partial [Planctomycetota bacterium]|nr:YeeE/YedE thiosulfate transporter family protein [Planctomycetota bacterium]